MAGGRAGRAVSVDPKRSTTLLPSPASGVTLICAKLAIWVITGSVAILGSLVDSGLNAIASIVTCISIRQAALPPDRILARSPPKSELASWHKFVSDQPLRSKRS
jgi:hypothetical protein